jgi:hypothetical protein
MSGWQLLPAGQGASGAVADVVEIRFGVASGLFNEP